MATYANPADVITGLLGMMENMNITDFEKLYSDAKAHHYKKTLFSNSNFLHYVSSVKYDNPEANRIYNQWKDSCDKYKIWKSFSPSVQDILGEMAITYHNKHSTE